MCVNFSITLKIQNNNLGKMHFSTCDTIIEQLEMLLLKWLLQQPGIYVFIQNL